MSEDDEGAALAHQQELEKQEQEMKNIAAAFVKAQAEIEKATKDKTNPHFRSKYADLGAVVDAIKPALEKNGLAFFQKFHHDDNGITVETIIVHESGETMSNGVLSVPASKKDAQGFGSACTYARRYSLQAAFGVAPEDDDGNAASQAKEDPGIKDMPALISSIKSAQNIEALKGIFQQAWQTATEKQRAVIKRNYDARKAELEPIAEAA